MMRTEERTRTTRWCRTCGYRVETETYTVAVAVRVPRKSSIARLAAILAGHTYGP